MTKTREEISIISLYNLLIRVSAGEAALPIKTLSRQSSLAEYTDTSLGILKTSLNTLKSKSNTYVPGGFKELDNQRRKALSRMQKRTTTINKGSGRSKPELEQKLATLKKDITLLEEDLLTLSVALESSISRATRYVTDTNNPLLIEQWRRERQEILSALSLRNRLKKAVKLQ